MAALEAHHAKGWKCGHDPDHLHTLCWAHHRAVHKGLLRIEGTAPKLRFVRLDGEVVGETEDASEGELAIAHENGDRGGEGASSSEDSSEGEAAVAHENADREGDRDRDRDRDREDACSSEDTSEGEAAIAHENADGRRVAPTLGNAAAPQAGRDPVRDATLALRSLGMGVREAKRYVQVALEDGSDRPWTAEDLVRAALLAS